MHADLVQLEFDGSYERVAAFLRKWKGERPTGLASRTSALASISESGQARRVLSLSRITLEKKEKSGRSRMGRTLSLGQVAEGMGLMSNVLCPLSDCFD